MAKSRAAKQTKIPADELKLISQADALREKAKGRDKTDAEKKQLTDLSKTLGAMRFVRLAKKRGAMVIKAVRNLAGLASVQYTRTPEQVKKLFEQITGEVKSAEQALLATKKEKSAIGIDLS